MVISPVRPAPPRLRATFDGKPEKLAYFLSRIWAHIDQYGNQYKTERDLVSTITDGMNEASTWIAQLHNKEAAELNDEDGFVELLWARFEDPDRVGENEDKIKVMKQGIIKCYRCGQAGHRASECLAPALVLQPRPITASKGSKAPRKPPDTSWFARQAVEVPLPTEESEEPQAKETLSRKANDEEDPVHNISIEMKVAIDLMKLILYLIEHLVTICLGIIVFIAEDKEEQQYEHNCLLEESDGVQYSQRSSTEKLETNKGANNEYKSSCCKVWFSLEIHSMPAQPEKTLDVECAVLDTIDIGIPITNPTDDVLELDVELIDAITLSGENKFVLEPKEMLCYEVKYSPATTGHMDGSVIFTSEKLGEFWYALKLIGQMPHPIRLPEIECELGKWVSQHIPLVNSTYEILELEYLNSNPGHFSMEIDPKTKLTVAPHSTTEISVLFCPSALGRTNHTASIIFKCPQFEEWVFYLSGIGRIPQSMEPASVSSCLGQHSSIIVNFKNPTFEEVVVDIILTGMTALIFYYD
ncbi:cilia- and flagella-associated protein 47 [Notechis scutatus]|uniref:Cilia- and flagella-associated protein 47 n=1 Tax=Notechis scutatus TaxID=8663 RepID=A0A6J1VMX6_9SAUR|nr:cilia- and flagella-associated protein 47 [Notechis scutatus]